MRKFVAPTIALAVLAYFVVEFVGRLFFGLNGDPVPPLIAIIVIVIGSALFQTQLEIYAAQKQTVEDLQQVKRAAVVFLQQARTESELLKEMARYVEKLNNRMMEVTQNPDLN